MAWNTLHICRLVLKTWSLLILSQHCTHFNRYCHRKRPYPGWTNFPNPVDPFIFLEGLPTLWKFPKWLGPSGAQGLGPLGGSWFYPENSYSRGSSTFFSSDQNFSWGFCTPPRGLPLHRKKIGLGPFFDPPAWKRPQKGVISRLRPEFCADIGFFLKIDQKLPRHLYF